MWLKYHKSSYQKDPNYSDRQFWSNNADPRQTAPSEIVLSGFLKGHSDQVYTVCQPDCIFWMHYSKKNIVQI